ncbi:MAG: DUF72 domain-containing protein [Nitrospira sp.]|nr:DUF72 domain-containing protein [Nitrospira sp.]
MLDYYSRDLNSVEINNSFYRLPSPSTFERWKDATPQDFCFAVKGSRYLTHQKKLLDPAPPLKRLMSAAGHLGPKLGPIVFQLPPHWRCNPERLSRFLRALPASHRYSIECRNVTWHNPEVYRLLQTHNVAFCLFELGGSVTPMEVTADFVYVRLHGPGNKYQGDYSLATLKNWCRRIRRWTGCDKDVYVYFDNDEAGYAVKNARMLRGMMADL